MVKDLGQQKTFANSKGFNTDATNTQDKQIDAMVNTQESASQAKTILRDAECGTKVMVESKGQQKNNVGEEKNIQCLIIKPEDYSMNVTDGPIENADDLPECFKCDGSGVNKKGL